MKVILILADGMRPDALAQIPAAQDFATRSTYTFHGTTVFPSMTLPCHMSLFHSVDPDRHGTTTNTFTPQVRPIQGLFDVLNQSRKRCAMFYDWEELRDLGRPGSLKKSIFQNLHIYGHQPTDDMLTDAAIECIKNDDHISFVFLYLGAPDVYGHDHGWMSEEYMQSLTDAWKNIDRVMEVISEDDYVIVTADHGGHDRTHGTLLKEDMEIPFFILGPGIEPNKALTECNIKDIAPTICKLFGVDTPEEWEGNALV